jgi:MFS family permease
MTRPETDTTAAGTGTASVNWAADAGTAAQGDIATGGAMADGDISTTGVTADGATAAADLIGEADIAAGGIARAETTAQGIARAETTARGIARAETTAQGIARAETTAGSSAGTEAAADGGSASRADPATTARSDEKAGPRSDRRWPGRLVARARQSLRSGPMADRNFRLLTAGQTTSTIGDFCYAVALPWMVLSARGGGVAVLGLVLACYGVPRTALIPVGGILADKISGRVVMLAADTVRCGLVCVLLYLDATHSVSLATLGPVAALVGVCSGLFIPASYTLLPKLLPPADLQSGNAISSAGNQLGGLVGPAIAGALVATVGAAAAFGVDAATFAVSAMTLALIRPSRRPDTAAKAAGPDDPAPAPDSHQARSRGIPSLLREPVLQTTMVVALIANLLTTGVFEVAMPDLAHERFGAAGYGAMLACFGGGALAGALLAARRRPMRAPALVACRAFIAASVGIAVIPFLGGLAGACAAITLLAVCTAFGDIILITLLQQWAPPDLLGRVMSMIMLASMGSFPLSVAISGFLVGKFGPEPFFPIGAVVLTLAVIVALCRPEIRTLGARSAGNDHRDAQLIPG